MRWQEIASQQSEKIYVCPTESCYRKIGNESNSVRSCQGVWNFTVPSVAHLEDEEKLLSAHQGNINPSRKSDKITSLRGYARISMQ